MKLILLFYIGCKQQTINPHTIKDAVMKDDEIIQNAELIANSPFASDIHKGWLFKLKTDDEKQRFYKQAKYHTDWNWLMGVVEKIEKQCFKFTIEGDYFMGRHNIIKVTGVGMGDFSCIVESKDVKTKLELTYEAVIQFIHHYNNQSNGK